MRASLSLFHKIINLALMSLHSYFEVNDLIHYIVNQVVSHLVLTLFNKYLLALFF